MRNVLRKSKPDSERIRDDGDIRRRRCHADNITRGTALDLPGNDSVTQAVSHFVMNSEHKVSVLTTKKGISSVHEYVTCYSEVRVHDVPRVQRTPTRGRRSPPPAGRSES